MSARNRNFGTAMRERDRRIAGLLQDPYDTSAGAAISDHAGNAFFGGLRELEQNAARRGMRFYADLGDIGRPDVRDPGLMGGLNPLERDSLKRQALQRQGDTDVQRIKAERAAQDVFVDERRDQLVGDLKAADEERAVNEAFADPRTTREQVLQRLPPALRSAYQQQWAAQDAARMTAQAAMTKATRDDSPLVAVMGPGGRSILVPRGMATGMQPASSREQGRPVTSGDAGRIADFDTSLDDVATLRGTLQDTKGATGTLAKIGASLPNVVTDLTGWGTEPKQRQAVIDRVKQVIGKALEGGVLRAEDERKYEKILPTIGDTADVAATKMNGLESALRERRQTLIDALSDAGYEVGDFNTRTGRGNSGASDSSRIAAPSGKGVLMKAPDGSTMEVDPGMVGHYIGLGASRVVR